MSYYEWFAIAQTIVMAGAGFYAYRLAKVSKASAHSALTGYRLTAIEHEIKKLREWKHDVLVPWQQELEARLEDRFVTRREYDAARAESVNTDTPWPKNRRRPRE